MHEDVWWRRCCWSHCIKLCFFRSHGKESPQYIQLRYYLMNCQGHSELGWDCIGFSDKNNSVPECQTWPKAKDIFARIFVWFKVVEDLNDPRPYDIAKYPWLLAPIKYIIAIYYLTFFSAMFFFSSMKQENYDVMFGRSRTQITSTVKSSKN